MDYQFTFSYPSTLPTYWIERAVSIIRELDATAMAFQPPNSKPMSTGFDKLFQGEADADKGHIIFESIRQDFSKPDFRRTPKAATNYLMCALVLAFHHTVHALQANTTEECSSHLENARYMLGFLDCLITRVSDPWDHTWQARKGAATTNSVYDSTKRRVFEWCKVELTDGLSTHAAAIRVAAIERIDPRTAKKYIKEYREEMQC